MAMTTSASRIPQGEAEAKIGDNFLNFRPNIIGGQFLAIFNCLMILDLKITIHNSA